MSVGFLPGSTDKIRWTVTKWFREALSDKGQKQFRKELHHIHPTAEGCLYLFFRYDRFLERKAAIFFVSMHKQADGKGEIMMRKITSLCMALLMSLVLLCGVTPVLADEAPAGSALGDNTLTVAMECAYAPYNWTQPDDSNGAVPIKDSGDYANGYDVMMAKKIAEALNMNLEIVRLDWDSLVPAVQSGTVDCVIAGQSITSERLESVDFTAPYFYASIVGLTRTDSPYAQAQGLSELEGATATSQLGTIWYDTCLPQIANGEILTAQESAPAMLMALETGRVNLVVTDIPTAKAALNAYNDFVLLDFTGNEDNFVVSSEDVNIGISVQKGNTQLKDAINGVLSAMTEQDYNDLMDDAIAIQPLSDGLPTGFMAQIGYLLKNYGPNYLKGAGITIAIAVVCTAIGCVIGLGCGVVQTIPVTKHDNLAKRIVLGIVRAVMRVYVEVFRGTPMILQAVLIFYGAAFMFNLNLNMWSAALIIVSINTGAYMAESVRGGILSIPVGQTEGAKAIGLTHVQTMTNVILPQALRNIMPQVGNNLIINIKDTSVLFIIGVAELFSVHKGVVGATYAYFPSAVIEMGIYLIMTLACSMILRWVERRMDGESNYELVKQTGGLNAPRHVDTKEPATGNLDLKNGGC